MPGAVPAESRYPTSAAGVLHPSASRRGLHLANDSRCPARPSRALVRTAADIARCFASENDLRHQRRAFGTTTWTVGGTVGVVLTYHPDRVVCLTVMAMWRQPHRA